ncbi:MAG: hypothetical protein QG622_2820 [Actinomycetota bacterium]|nr:hypothetical protein [Actinomycetota bacterium]
MTVTVPLALGRTSAGTSLPATGTTSVPTGTTFSDPSSRRSRGIETLAMGVGGIAAAWFLTVQVRDVDLTELLAETQARWAALAVLVIAASFLGAAWNLMGFSVVRLSLGPTVLVQLASGFVKVVSPAAVGAALLNARYLRRAGATRSETVTSIGAAQFVQFLVTVVFLGGLATLPGSPASFPEVSGRAALAVGVCVVTIALVAWLGRRHPRVRAALVGVRHELVNLYRHAVDRPWQVALGVLGSVVLVMSFALGLAISVRAFGGPVNLLTITIVFLAGSAAGSLVPSPGGLGTVEAALVTGLVATGQAPEVALPAVLWFRLVSVWIPVPLGWLAVHVLRRKELL